MNKNMQHILSAIILIILGTLSASITALGQVPGLSPTMMSDYTKMSPSQRKDLAKRYGVDLEEIGIVDELGIDEGLGTAGEKITSDASEVLYQRIIEAEDNESKAEEYRRKNVPIFERDFSTIDELPVFGQFLFDGGYSTYAPIDNAPVPNSYVIGTGDSLRVLMYGIKDSELILVVNREGGVNFPELGNVIVAGMTFSDARDYIKSRVEKEMIGVEVSISTGRLKSINIFMAGEIKVPGTYSVSGMSTVSQLLFVAGGMTDIGSLRNTKVRRAGEVIATFDLYDLITEGNNQGDIRLQSGDVIFIPAIEKTIFIDGAVKRPGRYELKENDTIKSLMSLAGGSKSRAYLKQVHIDRFDNDSGLPSIINLDLTEAENLNFNLVNGDIIRIAEVTDRVSNSINLKGAVNRPGKYGWYKDIKFTDIADSVNTDFSNNYDNNASLIVRRKDSDSFDVEVHQFSINEAIKNPDSESNPSLELHDQLLVFSLGHNDDLLNNIEIYNPKLDLNHPLYGREEEEDEIDPADDTMVTDPYGIGPKTTLMSQGMTGEELNIEIYESKKESDHNIMNKGKRRLLLKTLIKKLKQQATTSDSLKIVSISGAVKVPGEYPLVIGASYIDLINLAGGFSDDAYIEGTELRRARIEENGAMIVDTSDVMLKGLEKLELQSRDHLHVRNIKDWDTRDTVILGGEVFYPGTYLISPNERLSSLIERAGGFTMEGFAEGAIFTRESIKAKEKDQLQELGDAIRRDQAARSMTKEAEDSSLSSAEVEASIEALQSSDVFGRLIIDIPRLIDGDISADIVVQDGDVLFIPKFTNAVTVVGEVRRSGSFVSQGSYLVSDYLELAAGMTDRGDSKRIYIVRANGYVEKANNKKSLFTFGQNDGEIRAGDTIVVPIKTSYQTPLNLYSTVSQVVFQSIASIAAFSTIVN